MKTVLVVFGTRPEAIKLAPLILALRKQPQVGVRICLTGQHLEMLDQVLQVFRIVPDVNLSLMRPNQGLADFTARGLVALEACFAEHGPDFVLVQGDTSTAFAAALAAYYRKTPVGHVEAGLRTRNKFLPFPEEINRVLVTHLADYHFAPTEQARVNLLDEGVPEERVFVTGNTVIDALQYAAAQVRQTPPAMAWMPPGLLDPEASRDVVLITGHRREHFGPALESICRAIASLAERHREAVFVYPVHLNPNVTEPVRRILADKPNVILSKPLDYLSFVALMDRARFILTDSGGIQEEAPSLGKPVLVMREVTERPEGILAGCTRLVGTDAESIIEGASLLLTDQDAYQAMAQTQNPYGDGRASDRIAAIIAQSLEA